MTLPVFNFSKLLSKSWEMKKIDNYEASYEDNRRTIFNISLLEISLETSEAVEYSTRSISSGWFHNCYSNMSIFKVTTISLKQKRQLTIHSFYL